LAGVAGGLILAVLGALLVTIAFAASENHSKKGLWMFFVFWTVGLGIALLAPGAGKAWRRLLLTSAVLSFLLPISGLLFTGNFMAKMGSGEHAAASATGAAIGGSLISGFLGFVGFFLGVAFLIVGLSVGRDKHIVYIDRSAGNGPII
jgi:hypothetical protein